MMPMIDTSAPTGIESLPDSAFLLHNFRFSLDADLAEDLARLAAKADRRGNRPLANRLYALVGAGSCDSDRDSGWSTLKKAAAAGVAYCNRAFLADY